MKETIYFYVLMVPVAGLLWGAFVVAIYGIIQIIKERRS